MGMEYYDGQNLKKSQVNVAAQAPPLPRQVQVKGELLNAISKGRLINVTIKWTGTKTNVEQKKPDPGKRWLILAGAMTHVTSGVDTQVYLGNFVGIDTFPTETFYKEDIPTAAPNGVYNLFEHAGSDAAATGNPLGFIPYILTDGDCIHYRGNTNTQLVLRILEWWDE